MPITASYNVIKQRGLGISFAHESNISQVGGHIQFIPEKRRSLEFMNPQSMHAKCLYFVMNSQENFITMWQLIKELILFLRQEKKWWLIPLLVVLLILASLIAFSGGSVLAPLLYPFF